jgi:predicted transposase YbfD/YdcC
MKWDIIEDDPENSFSLFEVFKDMEDPRIERHKLYPLEEILFVTICAMICGSESWRDIHDFGNTKIDFLRQYMKFENGIPSKSTIARVFSLLNPLQFRAVFTAWIKEFQKEIEENEVIAIDGKTLRRSFDHSGNNPAIHMVSAFATNSRIVLGQIKVNEKSNEVTAIPDLLELLSIKKGIVTIDAMGCQKKIAQKILQKEANYILALKKNQGGLYDDIKLYLDSETQNLTSESLCSTYVEHDYGHGRIEKRQIWISDNTSWIHNMKEWAGLRSILMVDSERTIRGKKTTERRYFISSLPADAKLHLESVRSHWAIENSLHWTLDMSFREDESRIRDRNAAENIAIVRHISMNLLQKAKGDYKKDMSIRRLKKNAGWEPYTFLHNILTKKI